MSADFVYKLLFIGEASVGKTTLVNRYIHGVFNQDARLTIGVDFYSKKVKLPNGKKVKLQIWDFGGEERYRFLLPVYSKKANAAFYLFDLTQKNTLNTIEDWLKIVYEIAGKIPVFLIGSKADLDSGRQVQSEEALEVAKKHGLQSYIEISSKTGFNITESFNLITQLLILESEKGALRKADDDKEDTKDFKSVEVDDD
jgi:small GTP-binding protein